MNISPIDFNYIDGLNNYPIQDYIDSNISNISNNLTIYIDSNITNNINSSYVKITNVSNLNDLIYYNSDSNLIIANNYPFGDILFKTSYSYPDNNTKLGTKIDFTGKLLVYHNYNVLQPTFAAGYYDVEGEILSLKADGINTDIQLTALEAATVSQQGEIDDTIVALNQVEGQLSTLISSIYFSETYEQFRNLNQLTDYAQYQATYASTVLNIATRANGLYNNSFQNGLLISAGVGIAGAVLSAGSAYMYYESASNALISNINFTDAQKISVYNSNIINEITTYSNYFKSTCNMAINQGFISSNILNQQLIPKLKINEITLNNKTVNKFSLDALEDWIRTPNGIYYDISNGNLAISATPTLTDFLKVGGQTTVQGELIAEGRIKENSQYLSNVYASSNYLLNVSNVIITNSSNFTLGTSNILRGLINTNLNNSSNYASNISNVIITNTNATYLKLSGGVMSGQITGVSTISATTGIFGQVATTNNTNTGAPTNGVYGGTGDKLILWAGVAGTTLPYSLGINASELWYSVPTGASHKFYTGGGNAKMSISSSGNVAIGTINNISSKLTINDIVIDRWTYDHSTSPLTITNQITTGTTLNDPQPILNLCRQGVNAVSFGARATFKLCRYENSGYNSRTKMDIALAHNSYEIETNVMTLRSDGNVGIGTDNPTYKLHIRGANPTLLRIETGNNAPSEVSGIEFGIPAFASAGSAKITSTSIAGDIADLKFHTSAGLNQSSVKMTILGNGNVGIGINNPRCHLEVAGIGCINNGSPYAITANFMQSGSLTIGGINASYGGGVSQWSTNTAGLLLECFANTEIAVHDANTRVASLMYYEGEGTNRITIGRNMGWSAISSVVINGALSLKNSDWHKSFDNANRFYFANNNFTQYGNGGGVIGHDFLNNTNSPILTLYNDTNVRCTNNLEVVNYLYSRSYICTAEDYSYVVNWNGTTNSGWFVGLNKYWYSGHTCLNVSITALNAGGTQRVCWFGRVYLSFAAGANTGTPPANNGGVIQIITDYRNPASYSPTNYYIDVEERWDGAGNNVLFMRVANAVYGGTLRIKIRG